MKMNCALKFIISYHDERYYLSILLQLEQCNIMFIVISDVMAHCYDMIKLIQLSI